MGRQITVDLQALELAGCALKGHAERIEVHDVVETLRYATVRVPNDQAIVLSVYGHDGCVDCRGPGSPTYWFERWLQDNNVPYVSG